MEMILIRILLVTMFIVVADIILIDRMIQRQLKKLEDAVNVKNDDKLV